MARTNMAATRVRPRDAQLLTAHVRRVERLSPTFLRVTLGDGDLKRFAPMGFDQWFRMFLPTGTQTLERVPARLDTISYLRFLRIARTERPTLRNYSVAAFRPGGERGPELDVDFVLHGVGEASGPAVQWARACAPGDAVGLLDEGITYRAPAECGDATMIVADATAVPAAVRILASLPAGAFGTAVLEVPDASDRREITVPAGVDVCWVHPSAPTDVPGQAVRRAVERMRPPADVFYGWVAGEQGLVSSVRRHWIQDGLPRHAVTFTGYWRHR